MLVKRGSNMALITNTTQGDFIVLENDSLGRALIKDKEYEPHFLQTVRKIVSPGDLVIDCGSNLGYHTVTLAGLVGRGGKVIAFEPQRYVFQQLCGNVFLNDLQNVITYNMAVGDMVKVINIANIDYNLDLINTGATRVGEGNGNVCMTTLDTVLEGVGLSTTPVKFIKADVQGCEALMLDGAVNLIHKYKPFMFIEIEEHYLVHFNMNSDRLRKKVIDMGYIMVQIMNNYPTDHIAIPIEHRSMLPAIVKDLDCSYKIYE